MSLKVIGSDMDRSLSYDFLLVTHINYGTISYRFQDKFEIRKFSLPHRSLFITTRWQGTPWNFVKAAGLKKLRWCS